MQRNPISASHESSICPANIESHVLLVKIGKSKEESCESIEFILGCERPIKLVETDKTKIHSRLALFCCTDGDSSLSSVPSIIMLIFRDGLRECGLCIVPCVRYAASISGSQSVYKGAALLPGHRR
jgi:hypothetical protein